MINTVELKAHAKINLSIDVLRKRPDGYHDVRMIMQTVELHDKVIIEEIDNGIDVVCESRWIPSGSGNIAYKAANLLINEYKISRGVRIKIDKKIPVSAGLAGGSSDAAAVIKGMDKLFSLNLPEQELLRLGKQIGADVPYCIKGGTMLAEGIGEILTELSPLARTDIVLIKPRIGVSTPWVYKNLNLDEIKERPDIDLIIEDIKENRVGNIARNMKNVLETVTIPKYTVIHDIKNQLVELGAVGSLMSGSGPSVFGIFESKEAAKKAFEKIKNERWDSFLTETLA
ncbi:MAG: 4-(cytidine 5'-diphospho)-2-C-methyl-D-erythritol kinase [Clostridia bacterium]|nr:4-(cytidine 5'-diphospho)-2-C-methyl-D-erythritol kinase [Clostridia bacterium]